MSQWIYNGGDADFILMEFEISMGNRKKKTLKLLYKLLHKKTSNDYTNNYKLR